MRLFLAVDIPDPIRARIRTLTGCLRTELKHMRWSRPEGLHITLKFLGEVPEEKLDSIRDALAQPRTPAGFSVGIRGMGVFPPAGAPRILWVGIAGGEPLVHLAREVDERLAAAGFPAEQRPYSPHLTVARYRDGRRTPSVDQLIGKCGPVEMGEFFVKEFHLYESRPGAGGSIYTKIHRFPLPPPDSADSG